MRENSRYSLHLKYKLAIVKSALRRLAESLKAVDLDSDYLRLNDLEITFGLAKK